MKYFLSALLIILSSWQSAQAATLDDVVRSIDQLRAYIQTAVETSWSKVNDLIYEQNPSLPATIVGNMGQQAGINVGHSSADVISNAATRNTLLNKNDSEAERLASLPGSDTFAPKPMTFSFGVERSVDRNSGDKAINIETLLTPLAYNGFTIDMQALNKTPPDLTSLTKNPSYNFIQLVGGLYQPVSTISWSGLTADQIQAIQNSTSYQKYQAAIRAYIAAQSVGASNLYQMMVQRIPQAGLGKAAGMTDGAGNPIPDASVLQVDNYLATRRSQNQQWYKQMATASPTTISRETLFLLAEVREQLYQMQLQNQRLLATMSVMQLQNVQNSRLNLMQLEQAVDNQIKKAKGIETMPIPEIKIPGQ